MIKKGLFVFFLVFLLLPIAQQSCQFITSGPLYGFSTSAPNADFSWRDWWDEAYQGKKENFLNDNLGFRPDFIRFNNEIDYLLFGRFHLSNIVEGANHYLYMDTYIQGYLGQDYAGHDAIKERLKKLKAISDTLARMGKSLILIYSRAKEFMYPEFIPETYKRQPKTITNLEAYKRICDSLKINQIDFNTWFCSVKNRTREALYTRQGFHWSVYGSYLAADSLIKYIEQLRHIHMPHPVWTKIEHSEIPRDTDDDIAKKLNLISPVTTETFSYPVVSFPEDATMVKPKVIYIGDAFCPYG